jgi:hypothetical protein
MYLIYVFLDNLAVIETHCYPLFSDIPQVFNIPGGLIHRLLLFFRHSPIMSSITSFELDPSCVLSIPSSDTELFFPRSHNLTHINITFDQFHDCIFLLNQIGAQLQSIDVRIMCVDLSEEFDLSQISLVSNSFLIF